MPCLCFILLPEDTPSRWEVEETVRFKDLYDQDKDGKLNREEQLRWVAPNSYGSAREEVTLNSCIQVCKRNEYCFPIKRKIQCHEGADSIKKSVIRIKW